VSGAALSIPGLRVRYGFAGSLYGLGFALVGASVVIGCVLLERPKAERLIELSEEIFGG